MTYNYVLVALAIEINIKSKLLDTLNGNVAKYNPIGKFIK